MNPAPDPDVVVVGAGHNGLAATALGVKGGMGALSDALCRSIAEKAARCA